MAKDSVTEAEVQEALGFGVSTNKTEEKPADTKKPDETKKDAADEEEEEEEDKSGKGKTDDAKGKGKKSEEEEEEEEEEKDEDDQDDKKPDDSKKDDDDESEKKKDESDDTKKPDDDEAGKKTESKKKDEQEEEEEEVDEEKLDAFLAKQLEEFEIKDMKDLREVLEGIDELSEALEAERKKAKEPVFESDAQKKAFEFLTKTGYDPARFSEGILTHAKLIGMDVDAADSRSVLEEQYVLQNPDLTREEAIYKFNKRYKSRYEVDKTKYENPEDLADAEREAAIDKKGDEAKARKFLKEKQTEFKAEDKGGKNGKPAAAEEVSTEIKGGIKKTVDNFNSYMDGLSEVIFTEGDEKFVYKIPKQYLKQIQQAGQKYLSRPDVYSEEGVIPGFDPEKYALNVIGSVLLPDVVKSALRHTDRRASIKKAEEIAGKKPDRKGGKADGSVQTMSIMDQAELLADKKEKERNGRGR